MNLPLQITFRNMEPTESIKQYIEARAAKLDRFDPALMRCRVVVEAPHRHRRQRHYRVHIDVTSPRGERIVDRDPAQHRNFDDLYAALDETFAQMRRELEDMVHRRRLDVKRHETPWRSGRVAKLFRRSGYGFIELAGGGEVYFHKNAVLDHGFTRLALGEPVRFIEEPGDEGPQATAVVA